MSAFFSKKIIVLAMLITGVVTINAAVITVSTPVTKTTIQNSIDAASDGDVVYIPASNWNIDGTVNLKEGIHIQGAGRDLTTLIKTDATSTGIFKLAASTGEPFKISGINFKGIGVDLYDADPSSTILDSGIAVYGKATGFSIYDCRFQRFTNSGVLLYGLSGGTLNGHPSGVISNNEFKDNYWQSSTSARGYGVSIYGDDSWPALQLGNNNVVFVENNYFENNRHCIASNYGSRYVFRYNTVDYSYKWTAAVDTHGKTTSYHGSRSFEIYNNAITGSIWELWNIPDTWAVGIRGGDGVIFNNTLADTKGMFVRIENWNNTMTYPVADQTRDLWSWDNTFDATSYNTINVGVSTEEETNFANFLQLDRDFHEGTAKPGYVPYVYPHLLSSLRGHWKVDNANTIQVDSSASGNNGTKYGTPTQVTGYSGNALDFNGTSDYIQVPYADELNPSEFTVSAWAKVEGGADTYRALLSSRGSNKGYNIYAGSNNKWQFWTGNGSGYQALTGPDIVNNEWTHIAVTYSNNTKKLYVNGVEYSGTASSFVSNNSYPLYIGTTGNSYYFNGLIDDLRVYSRVLSQTEIKAMYNRMSDPSFEDSMASSETTGLDKSWFISGGTPTLDATYKYDGAKSVCFDKMSASSTQVAIKERNYIPVDGGKSYKISVWAKGDNIVQGTSAWHRLYVIGRCYDKNMTEVTGSYPDLTTISTGTFDWTKSENTFTAPSSAAYYRVTAAGIIGTGYGKGWLDLISFRPAAE